MAASRGKGCFELLDCQGQVPASWVDWLRALFSWVLSIRGMWTNVLPWNFSKSHFFVFRRGFCYLELENIPGGIYNVRPCTFYPKEEAPFFLEINSSSPISVAPLHWISSSSETVNDCRPSEDLRNLGTFKRFLNINNQRHTYTYIHAHMYIQMLENLIQNHFSSAVIT